MSTGLKFTYRVHESKQIDKSADKPLAVDTALCFYMDDETQTMEFRVKKSDTEEVQTFVVEPGTMIDFAQQVLQVISSRARAQG